MVLSDIMVQDIDLLIIEMVSDSEVGHADIGDMDFSIKLSNLEKFIEHHGDKAEEVFVKAVEKGSSRVLDYINDMKPCPECGKILDNHKTPEGLIGRSCKHCDYKEGDV